MKTLKEYMTQVETGVLTEMGQQNLDIKQEPGSFSITDPETQTNITTTDPATVQAAKSGKLKIGKVMETDDEDEDSEREARRETLKYYKQHDPEEFETQRDRMAMKGFEFDDEELNEMIPALIARAAATQAASNLLTDAEVMEVAPPGMEDVVLALKKKFPGQEGKAFAIAWSQYNKKHGKKTEESVMESTIMMPRAKLYEGTLEEVLSSHPYEHKQCQEGWGMDESLYEALTDHYFKEGRIPRSIWHGPEKELRDWVEECYAKDTGMLLDEDEMLEEDPLALGPQSGASMSPVPMESEMEEAMYEDKSYSAKKARAGKDIGKPGKNFEKIAKKAGKEYGSKEAGERVAGAVLAKLRANESLEFDDELPSHMRYKKPFKSSEIDDFATIDSSSEEYDDDMDDIHFRDIKQSRKFSDYDENEMNEETKGDPINFIRRVKLPHTPTTSKDYDSRKLKAKFRKFLHDKGAYKNEEDCENKFQEYLKKKEEKKTQPDAQMEAWDKQFDSILNEGQSVSISLGQENMPDSVTVTANDQDAHALIKLLQNAGMGGVVGAAQDIAKVTDSGDNSMMSVNTDGDKAAEVEVVDFDDAQNSLEGPSSDDNGDTALSFLKKMLGQQVSMEPGKHDHDHGEEVVYGGQEVEEGNKFTGNLAKAREEGKEKADLDGDGDLEDVKEDGVDPNKHPQSKDYREGDDEDDEERDDKAEEAGKKVAKDIEYDEGHKGKDDDKAEEAGKKVTKDIEYDDKKDKKDKVDEGEWDGTAMADMAAGMAQSAEDKAADETDEAEAEAEKAVQEGKKEHTCNECGSMMAEDEHECMECGYMEETEVLDEWANQVNSKTEEQEFTTEMDYMLKLISGGLNRQKVDQTQLPSTRVKVAEADTDVTAQLRKLAGIN